PHHSRRTVCKPTQDVFTGTIILRMNTAQDRTEHATNTKNSNILVAYALPELRADSKRSLSVADDFRPDFELALEEVRQRLETKTGLREEALQRFDRSEHRFWGINE